ncbi:MAG: histidine--tRNA ligase [Patescibacteria group bacterium]
MHRTKKVDKELADKPRKKRSREFITVTGMRDVLPQDHKYWQLAENVAVKIANDYGYGMIETPILEYTDVFARGIGKQTDIVEKEMFSFIDQGGDNLVLRPEGTASVARAFIQHGLLNQPQPVKFFYYGPMFRHEKPQSGRFRQFYQAGYEAIGEDGPALDSQLILMGYNLLNDLGIEAVIQVNSIGCPDCREEYKKALVKYYRQHAKDLCENCESRLVKNPLRLLDCKEPGCQELKADVPQILDYLDDGCKKHFMKVLEYLDELDLPYTLNPWIVRGLDYYNRTIFEYWSVDDPEGKNALGGGGRYDGLVELMGGRENTPACGLSIGMDRVIAKLREKNLDVAESYQPDVFIAQLGENAKKKAIVLYESLRHKFKLSQAFYKDGLKAQLEQAGRLKIKYCLILGQKEVSDGTIMFRDMNGGVQEIVDFNKIETELTKRLEKYSGDEGVAVIDTEETKAALSHKRFKHDYGEREAENDLNAMDEPAEAAVEESTADSSGEDY